MWKKQLRLFLCSAFLLVALLCALLTLPGRMPLWSQNSEQPLSGSDESLRTWETLSVQGRTIYETQKYNLEILRTELSSLKNGYDGLTHLYALLSQSNEDLNRYNTQIGERMQERDQDLAAAYDEIDNQGRTIPRLIIVIILLCIPYMVKLGVWVAKKAIGK
jgi:hypothetical protein